MQPFFTRQRFVFLCIIVITLNSLLVVYLSRDQFNFPPWLMKPLRALENLINAQHATELPTSTVKTLNTTDAEKAETGSNPPPQNQHNLTTPTANQIPLVSAPVELREYGATCKKLVASGKDKSIYSWVDEQGTRHLSDKPRQVDLNTPVQVIATIQPEAISINYLPSKISPKIKHDINKRVMASKAFFAKVTPSSLIRPVTIMFRLFDDPVQYQNYKQKIARTLPHATKGFYISNINESIVLLDNPKQGINTAVHEAMHGINRHWFGTMSKWLNEGIAEAAETFELSSPAQSEWYNYIQQQKLMPLALLFTDTKQHWLTSSNAMYATSWAYVTYLLENKQDTLRRYLLSEATNGCNHITVTDIERISAQTIAQLQGDFNTWLQGL